VTGGFAKVTKWPWRDWLTFFVVRCCLSDRVCMERSELYVCIGIFLSDRRAVEWDGELVQ